MYFAYRRRRSSTYDPRRHKTKPAGTTIAAVTAACWPHGSQKASGSSTPPWHGRLLMKAIFRPFPAWQLETATASKSSRRQSGHAKLVRHSSAMSSQPRGEVGRWPSTKFRSGVSHAPPPAITDAALSKVLPGSPGSATGSHRRKIPERRTCWPLGPQVPENVAHRPRTSSFAVGWRESKDSAMLWISITLSWQTPEPSEPSCPSRLLRGGRCSHQYARGDVLALAVIPAS
mmetsp:Transcript_56079/g.163848  ORF Transcript_56079/g.163848 Transcript_56079/m.163848 type:complete len:231 (+) Transcript_56079:148-840(+)